MIEAAGQDGEEVARLRALVAEQAAALTAARAEATAAKAGLLAKSLEIEKLKVQIARLRRMQFGRSSEKLAQEIDQLELRLEELEMAQEMAQVPSLDAALAETTPAAASSKPKPTRRPLPEHLPRAEIVHTPPQVADAACACASCGSRGAWRKVSEDVREVLEYVPGRFEVIRHVRPAFSCRACESMAQAPMPSLPIERGLAGPSLIAHVLISKYCDHLPLYRQSEIFARDGVEIERSVMAGWIARAAELVSPLVEAIGAYVMKAERLHADDTPVPVLAPGSGRTKTGRLWVYLRDERPHGGHDPPAVLYRYTPDRKGERPREHLKGFAGFLQADGYAGFNELYVTGPDRAAAATEVACWAHARRNFHDVHAATGSPLALEAMTRIGKLFEIERLVHGQPPEDRRKARQELARPVMADLAVFLERSLAEISGKSDLARAIRYARSRWTALTRYLDGGTLDISNNAAERAIRPLKLGAKNWLFAGSDIGGVRAAAIYTLIETARLNGLDPAAYLRNILAAIADHPINRIGELLPWNRSADAQKANARQAGIRPVAAGAQALASAARPA
jgi:transposase